MQATTPTTARREAIRAELEATRAGFHALLDSVSDADWKARSGNPAWTVGQLVYHLAWAQSFVRGELKSAMKGKGFNPPNFLINPLNELNTRFGAMRASRASIARAYDEATVRVLAELDALNDDDWPRSSTNYRVTRTVEEIFHIPAEHLAEHEPEIRQGLRGT